VRKLPSEPVKGKHGCPEPLLCLRLDLGAGPCRHHGTVPGLAALYGAEAKQGRLPEKEWTKALSRTQKGAPLAAGKRNACIRATSPTKRTVNGEPFTTDTIAAQPKPAATEKRTIHIHLAPFQVIDWDGSNDPGAFNRGWKDTVGLDNGGRAELLIRFDGYRGKYVLHCHNPEHEDMMMMANFEVI
jgi:hypothetical protein